MKKVLILLCSFSMAFALTSVNQTTIGCVDKNDLRVFLELTKKNKISSIQDFYKYTIENDCEMINNNDKIKLIGKPYSDGISLVNVKKFKKDLYIQTNTIKNVYTPQHHKLNKSF